MKLQEPKNSNYAAVIVKIERLVPLVSDGASKLDCDNVVGAPLLGYQAIVSKDTEIGTIGVVFTAETQLSEKFTKENNLFRHSELNKDKDKAGYIEDNRRVKAMKFRGHQSDALFMPLDSLNFTKANLDEFEIGDTFDVLGGEEICQKYEVKRNTVTRIEKNKHKVFKRVEEKFLPEHYDSDNYFRNSSAIAPHRQIIVTQKLHGTSVRIGNTIVKRQLTLIDKIAKFLGAHVMETEFDHVYGSRKVIKDINNPNHVHYYDEDIWTEAGKKIDDVVPENFVLYGELIGYTPGGGEIQSRYTYNLPHGENELYIYRVAMVNAQGVIVDLAWDLVKEFCNDRGLKHVPELWRGLHADFKAEDWLNTNYHDVLHGGYSQAVPLSADSPCDEGVCIRVDGIAPYVLKAKSPDFLQMESANLDKGIVDTEELGKETDEETKTTST